MSKKTKAELCVDEIYAVLKKRKMGLNVKIKFTKDLDWFGRLLVKLLNHYGPNPSLEVVEK